MKEIKLPEPILKGEVSLEEAIAQRRSVRAYASKDLTLGEISRLLWAAQGVTDKRGLRASPSAGALFPLEIYVVMKEGLFYYVPREHKLLGKKAGDLRKKLAEAAYGQAFIEEAPVNIVICAIYERITSRYGEKGIRYTHIEVGHAGQNIHLEAVALGLASAPIGAFSDNAVSELLGIPDAEKPLYIIPVGHKK